MILSVQNGSFGYTPEHLVAREVSFSLESGDLLAILGPNGAGKTTLLRLIMDFLKWQKGGSFIDGADIARMPYKKLWQTVAYVPQARQSFSAYTVFDTVLLGRSSRMGLFQGPSVEDAHAVEEILEQLGIAGLRDKKCSEISGGELQMALIARAMVNDPSILILDEPESNLDFKNQLIVLDTLSALAAEGLICVFNTHYPAHALSRANKSLLLKSDGEYLFGSTPEVVTRENIQAAFSVESVICDVETDTGMFRNVIPIRLDGSPTSLTLREKEEEKVIAVISIITRNFETAGTINRLLHSCQPYLIGRMGIPYEEGRVHIINVTLDAPRHVVEELAARLTILPQTSVKVTYGDKENP